MLYSGRYKNLRNSANYFYKWGYQLSLNLLSLYLYLSTLSRTVVRLIYTLLVRAVGGSNGLVQILLVAFILLVTITIANMIIAIIIANIKELQEEAEHDQLTRNHKIIIIIIQTTYYVKKYKPVPIKAHHP